MGIEKRSQETYTINSESDTSKNNYSMKLDIVNRTSGEVRVINHAGGPVPRDDGRLQNGNFFFAKFESQEELYHLLNFLGCATFDLIKELKDDQS